MHQLIVLLDYYTCTVNGSENNIYLGIPKGDNENTLSLTVECTITSYGKVCLYDNGVIGQEVTNFPEFNSRKKTSSMNVSFKSVAL